KWLEGNCVITAILWIGSDCLSLRTYIRLCRGSTCFVPALAPQLIERHSFYFSMLSEQQFDLSFRFFQLRLTAAREANAFFEQFQCAFEWKLTGFQLGDNLFECRKRRLKFRLCNFSHNRSIFVRRA